VSGFQNFRAISSDGNLYKHKVFQGSAYALYLMDQFQNQKDSLCVVFDSEEEARNLSQDLRLFLPKEKVLYFPAYDRLESELLPPNALTVFERMNCLKTLLESRGKSILISTAEAIEQSTLPFERLKELRHSLKVDRDYDLERLKTSLVKLGYSRDEMVASRGEFASRGNILDVFPSTEDRPFRLEFFGDTLESVRSFDQYSQRSLEEFEKLDLYPVQEFDVERFQLVRELSPEVVEFFQSRGEQITSHSSVQAGISGLEWLNPFVASSDSIMSYLPGAKQPRRVLHDLNFDSNSYFGKNLELFIEAIERDVQEGYQVLLFLPKQGFMNRVQRILKERKNKVFKKTNPFSMKDSEPGIYCFSQALQNGFRCPDLSLSAYTYGDFTGIVYQERKLKKTKVFEGDILHHFSELNQGDFVVHSDYGIAQFTGIENLIIEGIKKEFLALQFQGSDRVLVPITEVDRIHRFSVQDGKTPKLNKLSSVRWGQVKSKVKEDVAKYAKELLDQYARRTISSGFAYSKDSEKMQEMESSFEHQETPDQLRAIEEIKKDMEGKACMERLLCGDVGFGKTEVAVRSAFKAVQDKKQVAVLCPTTILSQQHFQTFQSRLMGYPVRMKVLNRFVGTKEARNTLKELKEGKVDILIGTHRLLSKDVQFPDLGLLIVDEEQRFGVSHKEKLKKLKLGVDTLTLSATPIPRTLHMSLGGLRAMSVIHTPPPGRLPIKTFVLPFQESTIQAAIERELRRNGQVFYVYNRVVDIEAKASQLLKIMPGLRLRYLHGQMDSKQVEEIMGAFLRREFDVLLATTIIESGMDIPNVNTIMVERADAFGLAQLYQLRGRIGRRNSQGYCYLFYKDENQITETAKKRLAALEEFTDLGSGFKIAMRDLEIRGAGNLLGKSQSGFLYTIGFDLYNRLLRDAIEKLRDANYREEYDMPQLELRVSSFVDENYIPSYRDRMDFFRRISHLKTVEGLEGLGEELQDRYGPFTSMMKDLFRLVKIRILGHKIAVQRFKQVATGIQIEFHEKPAQKLLDQLKEDYQYDFERNQRFQERVLLNSRGLSGSRLLDYLEKFFVQDKVERFQSS